jgi:hypothetical protein
MSLARWRDIFIIFGVGLLAYRILVVDVYATGRSSGDVFCEYLREQERTVYDQLMGNPKYPDVTQTCCAYDTGHDACETINNN